jgi:mono/diheme cytochrome c family protein
MWNAIAIGSAIGGLAAATRTLLLAGSVLVGALAPAMPARAQSRGELLYSTHCIACHTTQMHWRDKKSATDWPSLKAQVQRWQGAASLGWSEADVLEVTRYLNETIYRFEQKADPRLSEGRAQRPRGSS